ncbi:hypothetical protein ACF061_37550 [Streptomyces sp. NPDC015220]|uniref:hypothetical protein n=1 Tax=Streptomyces sp. NPDC015220 TaxID=3364947 RepID=UPI0036F6F8BE
MPVPRRLFRTRPRIPPGAPTGEAPLRPGPGIHPKEFAGRPAALLIDGVHRMYQAMVEGRATLPAHTLTVTETASIRAS